MIGEPEDGRQDGRLSKLGPEWMASSPVLAIWIQAAGISFPSGRGAGAKTRRARRRVTSRALDLEGGEVGKRAAYAGATAEPTGGERARRATARWGSDPASLSNAPRQRLGIEAQHCPPTNPRRTPRPEAERRSRSGRSRMRDPASTYTPGSDRRGRAAAPRRYWRNDGEVSGRPRHAAEFARCSRRLDYGS